MLSSPGQALLLASRRKPTRKHVAAWFFHFFLDILLGVGASHSTESNQLPGKGMRGLGTHLGFAQKGRLIRLLFLVSPGKGNSNMFSN